jgi:hypothetical protein
MPGVNARPDEAFFAAVKASAPAATADETGAENVAWRYGLRLLNAGFYWEAHEVLEPVWLNAAPNSRERQLVQAVIHLANGLLKQAMGRPGACLRLAELCRGAFAGAFPSGPGRLMGIDYADAVSAVDALVQGRTDIRLSMRYEI